MSIWAIFLKAHTHIFQQRFPTNRTFSTLVLFLVEMHESRSKYGYEKKTGLGSDPIIPEAC